MTKISIITIVRNDGPGLMKTRESIAAQSFRDIEWIIIDGASTDGTAQLIQTFDEPYVSFTSEPDRGIYDAMNKGIERATGEFIVFLNAADVFASRGDLEQVAERLRSGNVDFLYGDSLEAFAGERLVYKVAKGHKRVNYGMFACHQAMYYRRSLIGAQRYDPELRIAGDYAFTAQFLRKKPCVERVRRALCIFDLSGASLVNRRRGREENWQVQRDVLGISLAKRCIIRAAYLGSAFLATRLPYLYRGLRFRM